MHSVISPEPIDLPDGSLLLTVAIPTYNSAHLIRTAIDSVLKENVSNMELLIIDNASGDDTQDVVLSYNDPRIRSLRNTTNLGMAGNWNRCLAEARGNFCRILCADDALTEGTLQRQIAMLESHKHVSLVTCDYLIVEEDLKPIVTATNFGGMRNGKRVIEACLTGMTNKVGNPSTVMFRRSSCHGLTFDGSYRYLLDIKFFLQVLQRGDFVSTNVIGCLYRRHPESATVKDDLDRVAASEFVRLYGDFECWNPPLYLHALWRGGAPGWKLGTYHLSRWATWKRLFAGIRAMTDVIFQKVMPHAIESGAAATVRHP
jgi:glycosyltransferase involved in cell wall biosynthesis